MCPRPHQVIHPPRVPPACRDPLRGGFPLRPPGETRTAIARARDIGTSPSCPGTSGTGVSDECTTQSPNARPCPSVNAGSIPSDTLFRAASLIASSPINWCSSLSVSPSRRTSTTYPRLSRASRRVIHRHRHVHAGLPHPAKVVNPAVEPRPVDVQLKLPRRMHVPPGANPVGPEIRGRLTVHLLRQIRLRRLQAGRDKTNKRPPPAEPGYQAFP